jgi:dihydrofolate reductase
MHISLILAVSRNGVIGRDGAIPWRMSTDMRRFRQLTLGKPIIMGRKQYDSVGKPLDGRDNIVVTRNPAFSVSGVHAVPDIDHAIVLAEELARQRGADEIMIIGGAQIYTLALPRATRIYLSRVEAQVTGDVVFDIPDLQQWRTVSSQYLAAGEKDEHPHTFTILERLAGAGHGP